MFVSSEFKLAVIAGSLILCPHVSSSIGWMCEALKACWKQALAVHAHRFKTGVEHPARARASDTASAAAARCAPTPPLRRQPRGMQLATRALRA
jgi:hypothetical protein